MNQEAEESYEDTNSDLVPLLRHFEDKRRFPRVDVRCDVVVTTTEHEVVKVRMRNLSADGLQIRCEPEVARVLHPRGTQIVGDNGPELMLRFALQTVQGREDFAAEGQLRYIVAKGPGEIAFGVKFTRVSLETKKRLSDYLIEAMRPPV